MFWRTIRDTERATRVLIGVGGAPTVPIHGRWHGTHRRHTSDHSFASSSVPCCMRSLELIRSVELKVGLEIHVELSTRTKLFTSVPNPAAAAEPVLAGGERGEHTGSAISAGAGVSAGAGIFEPNTLIDPVVLALPGSLPVLNRAAVEKSVRVGLALGCQIAEYTKWDRKSYFYPDLPKNYQISQYELPLCFDGRAMIPPLDARDQIDWARLLTSDAAPNPLSQPTVGIIRAHLEEDAGKLMHEVPSGGAGAGASGESSIVDYNRAGTPLLEIVTAPEFTSADQVVAFAQLLRIVCRFVGATEGVMQKGHMRFEPNINVILTLKDGRRVATPVVEVKNLNSFKALRGAIEHELREQPGRWVSDGREFGPRSKTTRGWDGSRGVTFVQREKEDADDYRYFPDPDLAPVVVDESWRERIAKGDGVASVGGAPEGPVERARRFVREWALSPADAAALIDEHKVCVFFEQAVGHSSAMGVDPSRAAKACANFVLQGLQKRANERSLVRVQRAEADGLSGAVVRPVLASEIGVSAAQIARIVALREGTNGGAGHGAAEPMPAGQISAASADELLGLLASAEEEPGSSAGRGGSYPLGTDPFAVAKERGMLIVRDAGALDAWCEQAIEQNAASAADVRAGKVQAIGRLVGAVMKQSGGKADAAEARARLLEKLGQKG